MEDCRLGNSIYARVDFRILNMNLSRWRSPFCYKNFTANGNFAAQNLTQFALRTVWLLARIRY